MLNGASLQHMRTPRESPGQLCARVKAGPALSTIFEWVRDVMHVGERCLPQVNGLSVVGKQEGRVFLDEDVGLGKLLRENVVDRSSGAYCYYLWLFLAGLSPSHAHWKSP